MGWGRFVALWQRCCDAGSFAALLCKYFLFRLDYEKIKQFGLFFKLFSLEKYRSFDHIS
jgi:hypothetical protein